MVDWLTGKRIKGTSTERTTTAGIGTGVAGWVELGRTTLGVAGDNITISSLANKRYYMILRSVKGTTVGGVQASGQLGSGSIDTGSNYATRYNDNGGSDGTLTSRIHGFDGYNGTPEFTVQYISNYSTKEKLVINSTVSQHTAGAGNVCNRRESVWKWSNTSNALDIYNCYNNGGDDLGSGSEVVVLGWDPADTHSTNFWTELASVNATGSTTSFDSGVFTAKKYLWIQGYVKSTTGQNVNIRVGNTTIDSGGNYSMRRSSDGAADNLQTSFAAMAQLDSGNAQFFNLFIVNNATNEKLGIGHSVAQSTAGAGTAPSRTEFVGKWANTSNQINIIQFLNNAGSPTNYTSASTMKVWGSD